MITWAMVRLDLVDPYAPAVAETWSDLAAASSPGYFLSWGWIENWLACLPRDCAPRFALFRDADDRPRAGCFLSRQWELRGGLLPSRSWHLNTTGIARLDALTIEYNGLVGAPLPLAEVADLLPGGWDDFVLPGLRVDAFATLPSADDGGPYAVESTGPAVAHYVDLDRVRAAGDYLALLSGQTRRQIRRARKELGPLTVEVAADDAHALDIYDELTALHAVHWRGRGQPGAFADPWFDRLHRRLIGKRAAHGEIQLVRVRNAAGTVGCVYNFVWHGRVLQYQSGFAAYADPHIKPGYVCHAAAIEHAAAAGLGVYDLLAGDARYKRSLGTDAGAIAWARLRRRGLRFALERQLRRARESARLRQARTPALALALAEPVHSLLSLSGA